MTILWCGGEDVDFIMSSGQIPSISGHSWTYDSSYSRCGVLAPTSGYMKTTSFGQPYTNLWASFNYRGNLRIDYGYWLFGLINTYLSGIVFVYNPSSDVIEIRNTSNTILATSSNTIEMIDRTNKFDINVSNYGSAGTVSLYANGSLFVEYTGDITPPSGSADITNLAFWQTGALSYAGYISEIIVADEDTRLMRLKTLAPSAAGDSSTNWTGAYTDIDEVTLSDSDKIYSATDNADFQCNLTGMPSGTWSVKAVKIAARCVDGSGSTGIQLGVKSGGTVDSGVTQNASGYWQTKERLMQVNPVTGVAFTPAEIEALQINLRAKAL